MLLTIVDIRASRESVVVDDDVVVVDVITIDGYCCRVFADVDEGVVYWG